MLLQRGIELRAGQRHHQRLFPNGIIANASLYEARRRPERDANAGGVDQGDLGSAVCVERVAARVASAIKSDAGLSPSLGSVARLFRQPTNDPVGNRRDCFGIARDQGLRQAGSMLPVAASGRCSALLARCSA